MQSFKRFLTEKVSKGKNTHLIHIEDDIFEDGMAGGRDALNFLDSVSKMLSGSASGSVAVTTKWDGAPAVFTGINPENGKFFVATKSLFNVSPKINHTPADIRRNHSGGLADKLQVALKELSKLGIKGILQGDMMFGPGDVKKEKMANILFSLISTIIIQCYMTIEAFINEELKELWNESRILENGKSKYPEFYEKYGRYANFEGLSMNTD